jgi:REP element-mobilizing transposase RayT
MCNASDRVRGLARPPWHVWNPSTRVGVFDVARLKRVLRGTGRILSGHRNIIYTFIVCCVLWFLFMRFPRVKAEGQSFYHCISRVVDGRFIFGSSEGRCFEAERFLFLMRRLEAFSGVRILTYALMANHFHLLCEVPEPKTLSQCEVLKRIEAGYGPERVQALQEQLARFADQPDGIEQSSRLLESYRRRMNDISIFIKELKGRFAQWYNGRHERYGALWAERFKSLLLEGGWAVSTVAAYIDLNPVRAALCSDPKDYRYCGYAEALAKGSAVAHEGIRTILSLPQTTSCEELSREYRKHLFLQGATATENNPPAFELAKAQEVVEQENGELSLQERLRCKIRYFSDGVILGSRSFVESYCQRLKQKIGYKRKSGPVALKAVGLATLWVFRNLRIRRFG